MNVLRETRNWNAYDPMRVATLGASLTQRREREEL
jgi:hypothetical protein